MVWFHSMKNEELLQDQFQYLVIYIYAKEPIKSNVFRSFSKPDYATFKGTEFATALQSDLPTSLEKLYELYLNEPISDADRSEFLEMFKVPFMSTGKTVAELSHLNPKAFEETLDALIRSKRIQRIMLNLRSIKTYIPAPLSRGEPKEALMRDVASLQSDYHKKYVEQEGVIAAAWVKAIEVEPEFVAKNNAYNLTRMGIEGSKGGNRRRTKKRKTRNHRRRL